MFISKLRSALNQKIPMTRKTHINVTGHLVNLLQRKQKSQDVDKLSSKCKEYEEKLAKCPKKTFEEICCKPLFAKPKPKCELSIMEYYEEMCKDITNRTKLISKNIENESKSVLKQFIDTIEAMKSKEEAQFQEFSHKIKERLDKLTTLDPLCVSMKRKCALLLNYQMRQALNNLHRDIVPKVARIQGLLKLLERDVLICMNRARDSMLLCRKFRNPERFKQCIKENIDETKKLLDETVKDAAVSMQKAKDFQQETLKYHKVYEKNVMEIHQQNLNAFLQHLDKCIHNVKTAKKR